MVIICIRLSSSMIFCIQFGSQISMVDVDSIGHTFSLGFLVSMSSFVDILEQ